MQVRGNRCVDGWGIQVMKSEEKSEGIMVDK